jgi:hypothetical protein
MKILALASVLNDLFILLTLKLKPPTLTLKLEPPTLILEPLLLKELVLFRKLKLGQAPLDLISLTALILELPPPEHSVRF